MTTLSDLYARIKPKHVGPGHTIVVDTELLQISLYAHLQNALGKEWTPPSDEPEWREYVFRDGAVGHWDYHKIRGHLTRLAAHALGESVRDTAMPDAPIASQRVDQIVLAALESAARAGFSPTRTPKGYGWHVGMRIV